MEAFTMTAMAGTETMPMGTEALDEHRWQAVLVHDPAADGRFVYGVTSTGVYCRPTCSSRRPKRENAVFFDTGIQAAAAGYRACKRCRPDESLAHPQAEAVARACRLIETAEEPPKLEELAEAAGLSPWHFHRVFKEVTGVTPKDYAVSHRAARLRAGLAEAGSVTEALYDAGFNASSRFYAAASDALGMTPSAYRRGGAGEHLRIAIAGTSLGEVLVATTEKGVAAIEFGEDADTLLKGFQDRFPKAELIVDDPDFDRLVASVIGAIERPGSADLAALPLDLRGTAFQHRVWQALRRIPLGQTASYAEIAEAIGAPGSARAVAKACATNNVAVVVPCHRVVRQDGALSGYRWGVERKRVLLAREKSA